MDAGDRLLLRVGRHSPGRLAGFVCANLAGGAAGLVLPAAMAGVLDAVLAGAPAGHPLLVFSLFFCTAVAADAALALAEPEFLAAGTAHLRRTLVGHILSLDLSGVRRHTEGDLVSRVILGTRDAAAGPLAAVGSVLALAKAAGAVTALGLIDWRLAATFLAAAPLGAGLLAAFVRRTSDLDNLYQQTLGEIAARFADAIRGARTIRAAGTEDREAERILHPLPTLSRTGIAVWRANSRVARQSSALMPLVLVSVLAVAGFDVASARIQPGQVAAAAGYATLGLGVLGQSGVLMRLSRTRAGARRVADVLLDPPAGFGRVHLPEGPGELRLHAVTIRDGDRVLLDRVELTVPAGRLVAVVGRSGSGKSTLAAAAGRLIDPDEGTVTLDGVALADLTADALRGRIAYAFEDPWLFGSTIAEAVENSPSAARMARADEFIRRLPDGYATALRSLPLSGGELQRLGLARAFSRGCRVLILDDATSSLDMVTEAEVRGALADADVTRLVITHRAATAAQADLVVWLAAGRVRAVGPHERLRLDDDYRRLW